MVKTKKGFSLQVICLSILLACFYSQKIIYQTLSKEEIQNNISKFNQWFYENTGTTDTKPIELRLTEDGEVGVFLNKDFNADEVFLTYSSQLVIAADSIYTGKYADLMKELEAKYGYDELTYLVILLIHEYYTPDSFWRPYLDILPRIPSSPIYDYWNNAKSLEPELIGNSVLRKIVDYKISTEKKARNLVQGLFEAHKDLFDLEIFNDDNVEWALNIIDTRIQTINYR